MSFAKHVIHFIRREGKQKAEGGDRLRRIQRKNGFTLIELLIVVAIIAILAAIAVPNFLEAQVRAKVARAKSDHRTLATGLESYMVDENKYPPGREQVTGDRVSSLWRLTTPVSYVTNANMVDPFITYGSSTHANVNMYLYFCYADYAPWAIRVTENNANFARWGFHMGWCLTSPGPNRELDGGEWFVPNMSWNIPRAYDRIYDSSNGTRSEGDILRFGGEVGVAAVIN